MKKHILSIIRICAIILLVLVIGSVLILFAYDRMYPDKPSGSGTLMGNITISSSSGINDSQYQNVTGMPLLTANNRDGWKLAYVIFPTSEDNRTTYQVSMFSGRYYIISNNYTRSSSNVTYIGQDLPKTITIENNSTTYLDIHMEIVPV